MKVEFLSPFTDAAKYVLEEVIQDGEIKRGDLELRDDPHISRGIATLIGLTGQLRGHIIYDMEKKTALDIASIMNGETMAGVDNMVRSTINELANMITGNAAANLSAAGYVCEITPPTFMVGDGSALYGYKSLKHLVVPLITKCGTVRVSLAITDK